MKRVLLAGAVLALGATALAPAASARTKVTSISYTAKLTDISVVDIGATGASAGDVQTFTINVNGTAVGHGDCIFEVNPFALCTAIVADGSKGKLVATWEENANSLVQHAAVIGGTGRHRNSRGEATITQLSASDPTTYKIAAKVIG